MTETETILQCGMCHRQHDGRGELRAFKVCCPEIAACGRADCGAIVERILSEEAAKRKAQGGRRKAEVKTDCKPVRQRSHAPQRAAAPARVCDSQLPASDRNDYEQMAFTNPAADKSVSALDFETSANVRLLEFFGWPENFNRWFSAKYLEDEVGRTSGRMNNRAIWLRAKLNPRGFELDQSACPEGENLPNGSYYRICGIADSVRLSDEEKQLLLHRVSEKLI